VVEIDEGLGAPEALTHFLAGDEFGGVIQEHDQDLKGLGVQFDTDPMLAELSGGGVGLEGAEGEDARGGVSGH